MEYIIAETIVIIIDNDPRYLSGPYYVPGRFPGAFLVFMDTFHLRNRTW